MANLNQSRISIVPSSAVCDLNLSHIQLRVLLAIGSFTSKDRAAFPKQRTIAELLGVSRETVNRAIKTLREQGYVSVEHQMRDDGGQRESLYWVNLDPRDAEITTPVIEADPCDVEITPPVTAYDHTPCDATGSHLRTTHKNLSPVASATGSGVSAGYALALVDPEPPKGRVRGAARKTAIPANWAPSAANYAFASQSGLSREEINHEADQFRHSAIANKRLYADWHAAFRTWLGNTVKWSAERKQREASRSSNSSRNGGRPDAFDRLAERLSDSAPRPDAWQHDDPGTADGYVIDVSPARLAG